ncbi:MAG TPA: DinB family protein [Fimbriimonadaceae bacterium]|nr:DinB family protein [Fimbriimonadaceae bacterium]
MDMKDLAQKTVESACRVFLADLQAMPDDAFAKKFGDATRTVADIVYEVNLVNAHVCALLRGEDPGAWPDGGWIKAPSDFQDKSTVIAAFEKSQKQILETLEASTAESMADVMKTESGETTRFGRFQFMALHMWYHSGQLNYIQTLLGDDQWHW